MSVPTFWGIDPKCIYRWTPSQARELVRDFVEGSPATETEPAIPTQFAVYGKPLPGAPVILLKPMPERLAIRVNAARSRYHVAMSRARAKIKGGADSDDMIAETLDKLADIYPEDLQIDVLSACVIGWENLSAPSGPLEFTGKWESDAQCLPGLWKAELFRDIVEGSAFEPQEVEAFTLPQESQPT